MALTPLEKQTLDELYQRLTRRRRGDLVNRRFVTLQQRIEQLGMAIPPEMRRFMVLLGWPRVVIETITSRQQVRSLILPGQDSADETLLEIADANNLTAQLDMWRQDYLTYGRGFLSIGRGEKYPLIRAESPRFIEAKVDPREHTMTAAARFYNAEQPGWSAPQHATLYMPGYTKWVARENSKWVEVDVDQHRGPIPLVMHLNRRWSGEFEGESELTEINELVTAAIRSVTGLQFAQEAHGVPSIWATGVKAGDFVDADGKPLSQFETYYDVVKMLTDPNAKWGQFSAADLKNFETALKIYGTQAAISYGFPARMFGITTTNPPAEGAIIADEIQLVRGVEKKNASEGVTLGWALAEAYRIHKGVTVEGNRIRVEHFNPATPTVAQLEDALMKRRSTGVLSREGYWDELGWSEARKSKERGYLAAEAAEGDSYLTLLREKAERAAEPAEA